MSIRLQPTEDIRDGEKVFLINHCKTVNTVDGTAVEVVDYGEAVTVSELIARKERLHQDIIDIDILIAESSTSVDPECAAFGKEVTAPTK